MRQVVKVSSFSGSGRHCLRASRALRASKDEFADEEKRKKGRGKRKLKKARGKQREGDKEMIRKRKGGRKREKES